MKKYLVLLLVLFVFASCNMDEVVTENVSTDVPVIPDVEDVAVIEPVQNDVPDVVQEDITSNDENSENYDRLEPDYESHYCVDWLNVCFSVPDGYYVFQAYFEDFPQYSYLAISQFDDASYLPVGDGFMGVSSISLMSLDGYASFQDMIDGGVSPEYEIIPGEQVVTIGSYEFYKFLLQGFGSSEYESYLIEESGNIYDFKAGKDEENLMYGILETVEFDYFSVSK